MTIFQRTLSWFVLSTTTFLPGLAGRAPAAESDDAVALAKAEELLKAMTLDEKIGQMTQVDLKAVKDKADIARYALGSMLSGGDSDPDDISPKGWAKTHDELQSWALKSRLKIPLIYGIDAVHGHNNVDGAVIFPHNVGLGRCATPPRWSRPAGSRPSRWPAPGCAGRSPRAWRWPATSGGAGRTRASARTQSLPKSMGAAAVARAPRPDDDRRHLGPRAAPSITWATAVPRAESTREIPSATWPTLRKIHLPGYVSAIKAGVGSVMASYSSWNGKKMHGQ